MLLERTIKQEIDGKSVQILNIFYSSETYDAKYSIAEETDGFKASGTIALKNNILIPFELYQPTNDLFEARYMTEQVIENMAKEFGAIF